MRIVNYLDLNNFIKNFITNRKESLVQADLAVNNSELLGLIQEKNVLVIGGAGTIGSSYIKNILKYRPRKLFVIDTDENGLTELIRDLRSSQIDIPHELITYPMDFGASFFEKMFIKSGPFHIVANFAAHKHVRSEKDIYSIEAMINNNLIKAKKLLNLLIQFPPEHFFCVSTDKAANPVNIMGATKKLMEELIMAYSEAIPIKTARFANVAFSNGSLPLGFLERLFKLQPWSCPIGIKRFFVSPQEAGEICLTASVLGETGDIFFPKLDPERDMIDFSKIAIELLNFLGLEPDMCNSEAEAREKASHLSKSSVKYPIYFFTSDTNGEKSYEEFFTETETLDLESFQNLGVIKNSQKRPISEIDNLLEQITNLFKLNNVTKEDVIHVLKDYLPNFQHIETGKNLDQKM